MILQSALVLRSGTLHPSEHIVCDKVEKRKGLHRLFQALFLSSVTFKSSVPWPWCAKNTIVDMDLSSIDNTSTFEFRKTWILIAFVDLISGEKWATFVIRFGLSRWIVLFFFSIFPFLFLFLFLLYFFYFSSNNNMVVFHSLKLIKMIDWIKIIWITVNTPFCLFLNKAETINNIPLSISQLMLYINNIFQHKIRCWAKYFLTMYKIFARCH